MNTYKKLTQTVLTLPQIHTFITLISFKETFSFISFLGHDFI